MSKISPYKFLFLTNKKALSSENIFSFKQYGKKNEKSNKRG